MKKTKSKMGKLRRVFPPQNLILPPQEMPPNRVLSVLVAPGEKVRWIWSMDSRGVSYVSGYEILAEPSEAGCPCSGSESIVE